MCWPLSKRWIFWQCKKPIDRLFAIVIVKRIFIIVIHFDCVLYVLIFVFFVLYKSFSGRCCFTQFHIKSFLNFKRKKKSHSKITRYYHCFRNNELIERKREKKTKRHDCTQTLSTFYKLIQKVISCLLLLLLLLLLENIPLFF